VLYLCVYVCVCVYVYVYVCVYVYVYVCVYVYVYVWFSGCTLLRQYWLSSTYIAMYSWLYIYVYVYECVYICVCMSMCMCIFVYVCVYVYLYVWFPGCTLLRLYLLLSTYIAMALYTETSSLTSESVKHLFICIFVPSLTLCHGLPQIFLQSLVIQTVIDLN